MLRSFPFRLRFPSKFTATLPKRRRVSPAASGESLEPRMVLTAPYPLGDTFVLESLPGAEHTIYLDFDGHTTTGTTWNTYYNLPSISSPAYDRDGNASSFSNSELEEIQKIWQRAAEDFSPFEVNVTTKDPTINDAGALINSGGADTTWGVRVVMTNDNFAACGCGGFAFLNSFTSSVDEPVFAFNEGEAAAAETISHEVGHSLGLSHDGQGSNAYYYGHNGWAPIMGAGFYSFVTQWSKGEYSGATNQEDDLAIITSPTNGFGYRADDHSDTLTGATPVPFSNALNDAQGIIETSTDVDVFTFSSDGSTRDLFIIPAERGGNLDIAVDIYDSNNVYLGTSNPAGALFAGGTLTLPAGNYSMHVYGTGYGDPQVDGYSDYGSIGQYFIQYSGGYQPSIVSIVETDANKAEGDNGTTDYTFTVSRSGDTNLPATVEYQSVGVGIFPATDRDFANRSYPSGTVSFAPGQSSVTVSIPVKGDRSAETDETFAVEIYNPSGGMILGTAVANGTIVADDGTVLAMIPRQGNLAEGDSGATNFEYDVVRYGDLSGSSTVDYDVSSRGGRNVRVSTDDFIGNAIPSGTVVFQANEATQTIVIPVKGDTDNEGNERFKLSLSSPSGIDKIYNSSVDATILNDDSGTNAAPPHSELHDHDEEDSLHIVFQGKELHFTPLAGQITSDDEDLFLSDQLFATQDLNEETLDGRDEFEKNDEPLHVKSDDALSTLASHAGEAAIDAIIEKLDAAEGFSGLLDDNLEDLLGAISRLA